MAIKRDKIKQQRTESNNSTPPPSISNLMNNMIGGNSGSAPLSAALATREKNSIVAGNFILTMTGLQIDGEITSSEWLEFTGWVSKLQDSIQWILGDLVNYASERIDEWVIEGDDSDSKYKLFLEQTDYSYSSLRKFASIASRIQPERRFAELSYSHHVEVADLTENEQENWLRQALEEGWGVRQLREAIHGKPPQLSALDKIINSTSSNYDFVEKQILKTKGREKVRWLKFIQAEAERWQRLADEHNE